MDDKKLTGSWKHACCCFFIKKIYRFLLNLLVRLTLKIYPTVNNDSTVKSHLSKLQLCTARKYNTHFNYVQCVHAVNVEMLQSQDRGKL